MTPQGVANTAAGKVGGESRLAQDPYEPRGLQSHFLRSGRVHFRPIPRSFPGVCNGKFLVFGQIGEMPLNGPHEVGNVSVCPA